MALLDKYHLDPPLSFFKKHKLLLTTFDLGAHDVPWSPQLFHNFPGSPSAHSPASCPRKPTATPAIAGTMATTKTISRRETLGRLSP